MSSNARVIGLLASIFAATASSSASALVGEAECAAIRALSAESGERVFFQYDRQSLPVGKNAAQLSALIKSSPGRIRFVYLAKFDGDASPTLMSIIVRFLINEPDQFLANNPQYLKVYTYNSIRDSSLWTDFDAYQDYHNNRAANHQLSEWFHIGPGFSGWTRNLFESSAWERPRVFFVINGGRTKGEGIYSYIIALRGMNDSGTCFDTSFVLPPSLRRLSFLFRNLRPQDGQYLNPIATSVEFAE